MTQTLEQIITISNSPEEAKEIQEIYFNLGAKWGFGDVKPKHLNASSYVKDKLEILQSTDYQESASRRGLLPLTIEELRKLTSGLSMEQRLEACKNIVL